MDLADAYSSGADSETDMAQYTVINDNIHGHIRLSRDLMRIVNTGQMQRLRDLKQLGLGSWVYPGATHTRFAHSIGTCHLAGKFLEQLQRNQPGLKISKRDVFCVQVAGLCHDMGHGPFSHMFESAVKAVYKERSNWKHEEASRQLFERMVCENELGDLFLDGEIDFIKEIISSKEADRKYCQPGKEFLYEIIDNQRTGADVDKFDYFARDCHALGFSYMFDHNRFMMMARALWCPDGKRHICHRDKEINNVIELFHTRAMLHLHAYKHPVVCALDKMVCDSFEAADPYLLTPGQDGKEYSLSHCIDDMDAFARLSDSVLLRIRDLVLTAEDRRDKKKVEQINAAQELVRRINRRRLYKMVGDFNKIPKIEEKTEESIEEKICELGQGKFGRKDIYVQIAKIHYGLEEQNPLKDLYFYSKQSLLEAKPGEDIEAKPGEDIEVKPYEESMVSQLCLPKVFMEKIVRVYCKADDDNKLEDMKKAAEEWEQQLNSQ